VYTVKNGNGFPGCLRNVPVLILEKPMFESGIIFALPIQDLSAPESGKVFRALK
jgi:hypothetical protein